MVTYLALCTVFLLAIVVVLIVTGTLKVSRRMIVIFILLALCTAVFDSLIVLAGIVQYDTSRILGIYVGAAPIEDFFYALLAVLVVPAIWHRIAKDTNER